MDYGDRLKSNEYLEELRDKVAADIYAKKMLQQLDIEEYDAIQHCADVEGLSFTEYTAKQTINLANTFITMLRKKKMEESKQ